MASEPVARSESFTAFIPELERLIAEVMDERKVPGLAVAVVQNGEVAFVRPYGLRDVEAGLKVTTDTQFLIGSVTKSFTSTGLALLMDERRIDWTKPVRDYIPEFRLHDAVATDRITVRDCSAIIPDCRAMIGYGCPAICHPRKCWRQCAIWSRATTFAAATNTRTLAISSQAWWPNASAVRVGRNLPALD